MKQNQYNPEIHHRRSIRLKGHDYAGGGVYFVTICAHREAGNIFAAASSKRIVSERIRITAEKFPDVQWLEWVIMPDHVHALIHMQGGGLRLGEIIGGFKSAVSREIHRMGEACLPPGFARTAGRIWHRNYYEMIVRSEAAEKKIAVYIRMNPWKCVQQFANGLCGIGNPALWNSSKFGILASRGEACLAPILKELGEAGGKELGEAGLARTYLGGWHSSMEKAIFAYLLKEKKRIIACPAWGIEYSKYSDEIIEALQENRLLILEMRNCDGNIAAAEARNRFVIENSDELFVPHVSPGGMLDKMLHKYNYNSRGKASCTEK